MSRLRDRKRDINTILSGFRSDAFKEFSSGLNETNAVRIIKHCILVANVRIDEGSCLQDGASVGYRSRGKRVN